MNRRTFLTAGAVAALTAGHAKLFAQTSSVPEGQRKFTIDNISCLFKSNSALFLRNNRPILSYVTTEKGEEGEKTPKKAESVPFPCFTRLTGPTSLVPLSPINVSAAAAFVCDEISGINYTANFLKKSGQTDGQIRSNGLKWIGLSDVGGNLSDVSPRFRSVQFVFEDSCDWVSPATRVQMTDRRRFRVVFFDPQKYGIYVTINWFAVNDVQISANRQCLFGVQTSAPLSPAGGGQMMNSNGVFSAGQTYGRRANWLTCWGESKPSITEGIAVMSHPANPWGVSPWNTTEDGYMSPTNIPFLTKPWNLRAGQGIRLRYLVLVYTGDPNGGTVDEIYRNYIQT